MVQLPQQAADPSREGGPAGIRLAMLHGYWVLIESIGVSASPYGQFP